MKMDENVYDNVYARCPKCGENVEFQSSAGECLFERFTIPGDIPLDIAVDLLGSVETCSNGHEVVMQGYAKKAERPPQRWMCVVNKLH